MKQTKQTLLVILSLTLILTLCLGVLMACEREQPHRCESECPVCELCTNMDCKEYACKNKCKCNAAPEEPTNPEYVKDMDIPANPNSVEDYTLPTESGKKQVVFYWRESGHDYADNDIWMWEVGGAEGQAFPLHPCSYGAKMIVNVPSNVMQVGFIVRKGAKTHTGNNWDNAGKVYDADRFAILTGDVTEIYLTGANAYQFTSADGGKTLTMVKAVSKMLINSFTGIDYGIIPSAKINNLSQITVKCDGQAVEVESVSTLGKTAASGTIKLASPVDLSKNYEVTIEGYDPKVALPSGVFDSSEFAAKYNYDGELGVVFDGGSVCFKLWAPTASKVVLNLYQAGNGGPAAQTVNMIKGDKGVWTHEVEHKDDVVGKYYTYTVTTSAGAQEAVDPYAKSAGINGMRGMVIDLRDTNPTGFADSQVVELKSYTDAIIWETHVRDFSNGIADSQYKGKYLAFTETGLKNSHGVSVGVDYLVDLGVTHVHLLPVFDYKSVDESRSDQFNWGYDPQNYNVPEGSYSTNPSDGTTRVVEFKQMVQALHAQGLGVVMDMVYNHTYDKNSNLNMVVPNYYYRYNSDGSNSSGSGCGNDTASERPMFRKYMVDSVSYWVSEYKLDGLRFDLMGLHDVETMRQIEQAVHAINPNAILYGEGWTMSTAAKSGTTLATQENISQIKASQGAAGAIAVFNDAIRDGLRGSVFNEKEKGYMIAATNKEKVAFGIQGGEYAVSGAGVNWTVKNAGVINYISAHDNHTLWDRLRTPFQDDDTLQISAQKADLLAMNRLGAATVMLSKGTPFMTAGEEILRTKLNADGTFNHNSYNSSDAVNNIKWEGLTEGSDELAMYNYYKGLIQMRKGFPYFHEAGVSVSASYQGNCIVVRYTYRGSLAAVAVINGTTAPYQFAMPSLNGSVAWSLVCDGTQAGTAELSAAASGQSVNVPASSVHVYVVKASQA